MKRIKPYLTWAATSPGAQDASGCHSLPLAQSHCCTAAVTFSAGAARDRLSRHCSMPRHTVQSGSVLLCSAALLLLSGMECPFCSGLAAPPALHAAAAVCAAPLDAGAFSCSDWRMHSVLGAASDAVGSGSSTPGASWTGFSDAVSFCEGAADWLAAAASDTVLSSSDADGAAEAYTSPLAPA